MTRVTRLIRHRLSRQGEAELTTSNGASRTAKFVRVAGQVVPRRSYRVTFCLDPRGPLEVSGEFLRNCETRRGYIVCFLPPGWHGQRVSRTVRML